MAPELDPPPNSYALGMLEPAVMQRDEAVIRSEPGRRIVEEELLRETADGLYCAAGDFYIDPWNPVRRAVVTHAHGDHARAGPSAYLCAEPSVPLLRARFGTAVVIQGIRYGESITLGDVRVSLHPAGHILGSAQVRIEGSDGVWVISGDYKRVPDPTCAAFEAVPCDTFITESTFALPIFRWDTTQMVIDEVMEWWAENRDAGRASLLFCYTLGKAQRLLAELAGATDRRVLVHGSIASIVDLYRAAGIRMLETTTLVERARGSSCAGELVLAPLHARGTPWMRRLGAFSDAFASGTMRIRGVRRQHSVDRGFVLSDHADWPALLRTVEEVGASRVLATHGHPEALARHLGERGMESGVIRTAWESEGDAP
jgi:putative mRNA 3-end processing factor